MRNTKRENWKKKVKESEGRPNQDEDTAEGKVNTQSNVKGPVFWALY